MNTVNIEVTIKYSALVAMKPSEQIERIKSSDIKFSGCIIKDLENTKENRFVVNKRKIHKDIVFNITVYDKTFYDLVGEFLSISVLPYLSKEYNSYKVSLVNENINKYFTISDGHLMNPKQFYIDMCKNIGLSISNNISMIKVYTGSFPQYLNDDYKNILIDKNAYLFYKYTSKYWEIENESDIFNTKDEISKRLKQQNIDNPIVEKSLNKLIDVVNKKISKK